jgi:hypothetical protein
MKKLSVMIGIVIAVVMALSLALPAMAVEENKQVNTEASIDGGSDAPTICASFVTPDDNEATTNAYSQVIPEPPTPPFPDPAVPGVADNGADGWRPIKFYIVLDDINDLDSVKAIDLMVYYPNVDPWYGDLKFQVFVVREDVATKAWSASGGPGPNPLPYNWPAPAPSVRQLYFDPPAPEGTGLGWDHPAGKVDMNGDCDVADAEDMTVPDALAAMGSAVKYGNVPNSDPVTKYDIDSVLYDLEADKQIMVEIVTYMWFHQPGLRYKYTVQGVDTLGATTPPNGHVHYFDYLSIVSLYTDFSQINWGSIIPGVPSYVEGDCNIFSSPPTIWNNGNADAMLGVTATRATLWIGGEEHPVKYIDKFDVHIDIREDQCTGPVVREGTVIIDNVPEGGTTTPEIIMEDSTECAVLIPSCQPQQIDFSIYPMAGLPAGTYKGTITLHILPHDDTNCPTGP